MTTSAFTVSWRIVEYPWKVQKPVENISNRLHGTVLDHFTFHHHRHRRHPAGKPSTKTHFKQMQNKKSDTRAHCYCRHLLTNRSLIEPTLRLNHLFVGPLIAQAKRNKQCFLDHRQQRSCLHPGKWLGSLAQPCLRPVARYEVTVRSQWRYLSCWVSFCI
jgi:hypothetical protein